MYTMRGRKRSAKSSASLRRSPRHSHSESSRVNTTEVRPARVAAIGAVPAAAAVDSVQPGPSGVQRFPVVRLVRPFDLLQRSVSSSYRMRMETTQLVGGQPRPVQVLSHRHQQQQQQVGNLLLLTNENREEREKFTVRPESRNAVSTSRPQRDVCLTLACLRRGLAAYERIKTNGNEIDYLESYCCKFPNQRRFILFKRIILINPACQDDDDDDDDHHDQDGELELIRLYVRCFAILGNFCTDYVLTLPLSSEILPPNVLVVDKVWIYDANRRVYKPNYVALKNDHYTIRVMRLLKDLYKCESVRFVSMSHTSMFTNSSVLQDVDKAEQDPAATLSTTVTTTTTTSTTTTATTDQPREMTASQRPFKKRKDVLLQSCIRQQPQQQQSVPAAKKRKSVSFADDQWQPQQQKQQEQRPEQSQQQQQSPSSSTTTPTTPVSLANPTMIVFKANSLSAERQLTCIIHYEVHLADKINL